METFKDFWLKSKGHCETGKQQVSHQSHAERKAVMTQASQINFFVETHS